MISGVLGIGSLPFTDPAEALAFVRRHSPEIPYWPQLPQRSKRELMTEQVLHGLDESSAAGWHAFLTALEAGDFVDATALKGQVLGPSTAAALGRDLTDRIEELALMQMKALLRFHPTVLLQIDEPMLSGETANLTRQLIKTIADAGALTVLHHCGSPPAAFYQSEADVLSIDWTRSHGDDLKRYIEEGGIVALPAEETPSFAAPLASREIRLVAPACGLAFHSVESAHAVMDECRARHRLLRETRG